MLTSKDLLEKYGEFNKAHFDGQLPECALLFDQLPTNGEWTLWDDGSHSITLHHRLSVLEPWISWIVLLHEMAHVYCEEHGWDDHVVHGPSFQKAIAMLQWKGAYTGLL